MNSISRFDIIELRALADQTAVTGDRSVPVSVEFLHELLDAYEDAAILESDLAQAKDAINKLEGAQTDYEDAISDMFEGLKVPGVSK